MLYLRAKYSDSVGAVGANSKERRHSNGVGCDLPVSLSVFGTPSDSPNDHRFSFPGPKITNVSKVWDLANSNHCFSEWCAVPEH
ncbi:hypothetical protein Pelo_19818 [Pelomyxa schiedti]|nr:hypothetical protein Pelo_19818 [Pelomyxa schiedti]